MYVYSGKTDIGYNRTYNEDYLYIKNLDKTEKMKIILLWYLTEMALIWVGMTMQI